MRNIILVGAFIALMHATGCTENPVVPEEHFEVRGLQLRVADSTVVTVESNRVNGSLVIDSIAPTRFGLSFISDDGTLTLPPHAHGDEVDYTLEVEIADTTIARVEALEFDHAWSMTIRGLRTGTTTATIHLLHGGHDDFVSLAVPIVVTQ